MRLPTAATSHVGRPDDRDLAILIFRGMTIVSRAPRRRVEPSSCGNHRDPCEVGCTVCATVACPATLNPLSVSRGATRRARCAFVDRPLARQPPAGSLREWSFTAAVGRVLALSPPPAPPPTQPGVPLGRCCCCFRFPLRLEWWRLRGPQPRPLTSPPRIAPLPPAPSDTEAPQLHEGEGEAAAISAEAAAARRTCPASTGCRRTCPALPCPTTRGAIMGERLATQRRRRRNLSPSG